MKKVIVVAHSLLTLVLLIAVLLTSYFSPLSEFAPIKRKVSDNIEQYFQYGDNEIYVRGASYKNDLVVIGYDNWNFSEGNLGGTVFITRDGKIKIATHKSYPEDEMIAYTDEDGDGLPEKKAIKSETGIQVFEMESVDWTLTKENRYNQTGDDNSE